MQINQLTQNYPTLLQEREKENPRVGSYLELRNKEVGEALKEHFKMKNPYFLFTTYSPDQLEYALKVCQKKGIKKLPYLLGILRNL